MWELFPQVRMDNRAFASSKNKSDYDTVIIDPDPNRFIAAAAEQFLQLAGVRRLISLIQRAQNAEPWKEMVTITKVQRKPDRNGAVTRTVRVSKYGHELRQLKKLQKANLLQTTQSQERYEQLLRLSSVSHMTDEELEATARKFIAWYQNTSNEEQNSGSF